MAFYSDKASIFRVTASEAKKTAGITQFGRALSELNIDIVCANTPQAKGRVERAHLTLQDRLVKELRLRGLSTPEAGNAYLPGARAPGGRPLARDPAPAASQQPGGEDQPEAEIAQRGQHHRRWQAAGGAQVIETIPSMATRARLSTTVAMEQRGVRCGGADTMAR